jgi:hypothetical protein
MCKGTGMAQQPLGSILGVVYNNQAQNGLGSFTQQSANQYNQALMASQHAQHIAGLGKTRKPKQFMIEGKEMDLIEFAETLFPEDCPERTYILLKFKEK